jgi:hypothetical protein
MLKIWAQKSTVSTIQQVRISELLNHLFEDNFEHLTEVIKEEITVLLDLKPDDDDTNFIGRFQQLLKDPTTESYEKLLIALRNVEIDKFSQEEMKSFFDLVELIKSCDWIKFERLVIQVLNLIKNSRKIDRKMILLLKFETVIKNSMSMNVKELLLETIFTCMSDMDKFQGLSNLIDKFLEELLNKSYATRRVWFELTKENEENFNVNYMIDESLTVPQNNVQSKKKALKRKIEDTKNLKQLEEIFNYSERLKDEKLSEKELEIITKITKNFQAVIKNL